MRPGSWRPRTARPNTRRSAPRHGATTEARRERPTPERHRGHDVPRPARAQPRSTARVPRVHPRRHRPRLASGPVLRRPSSCGADDASDAVRDRVHVRRSTVRHGRLARLSMWGAFILGTLPVLYRARLREVDAMSAHLSHARGLSRIVASVATASTKSLPGADRPYPSSVRSALGGALNGGAP